MMVTSEMIPVVPIAMVIVVASPPIVAEGNIFVAMMVLPGATNVVRGREPIAVLPAARPIAVIGRMMAGTSVDLSPITIRVVDRGTIELSFTFEYWITQLRIAFAV